MLVLATKNKETKHHVHSKHKTETEKTAPALSNRTVYTLISYVFYDLRPGNRVGRIHIAIYYTDNQECGHMGDGSPHRWPGAELRLNPETNVHAGSVGTPRKNTKKKTKYESMIV